MQRHVSCIKRRGNGHQSRWMFQLGEQQGQLFGVYMPAMVPEVPQFSDNDNRLEWAFENSQAQGTVDDELYVAFG